MANLANDLEDLSIGLETLATEIADIAADWPDARGEDRDELRERADEALGELAAWNERCIRLRVEVAK